MRGLVQFFSAGFQIINFITGILKYTVAELYRTLAVLALHAVEPRQRDDYLTERLEHRAELPLNLADRVVCSPVLRQHLRCCDKPFLRIERERAGAYAYLRFVESQFLVYPGGVLCFADLRSVSHYLLFHRGFPITLPSMFICMRRLLRLPGL